MLYTIQVLEHMFMYSEGVVYYTSTCGAGSAPDPSVANCGRLITELLFCLHLNVLTNCDVIFDLHVIFNDKFKD